MKRALSTPIPLASPAGASLTVVGDEKHTCLVIGAGRTSRAGAGQPRGYITISLSPIGREHLLTGLLDWRYADAELPDDNCRVLIAIDSPHSEEPAFGFHDADHWYFENGDRVDQEVNAPVYAWAHIPAMPAKKGGRQ
jgi:hypothetical protein